MRQKQNNPVENDRNTNDRMQSEISSDNIRNAHASGDGSLSRSDMLFPEKNERFQISEEDQEQEQNY